MRMGSFICALGASWCLAATVSLAGAPEPVALDPLQHNPAVLEVIGGAGSPVSFTPADLERLPTYRITTKTPWRDAPAVFDGVLLDDLLRETGLFDAPAIRVVAENDFASVIPRDLWQTTPVLVATRVDGAPHARRARGPIQFVIDMETYETSDIARESHLVWMAARIEAVE